MKIIEFIKDNPNNWKELLAAAPYNLRISEKGNYILFRYSQINSDFNEEICKEARGLILKKPSFKVVRIAFDKFFNIGESYAAAIDWNSAEATMKMDGSLISIWFDDNEWHISTNGNIDAKDSPVNNGEYKTFYDLFLKALSYYNLDFNSLNKDYTYTFELCTEYNTVVINYNGFQLYHILTRNNKTFEEIDIDIGILKPIKYKLNNMEDYQKLVDSFGEDKEGIVVKDKFNNRLKMKTLSYFNLHHMVNNNVITLKRAVELIRENDQEEFLSYFPKYREYFDEVSKKIDFGLKRIKVIEEAVNNWIAKNPEATQKDFANYVKENSSNKDKWIYFDCYKGFIWTKINDAPASGFIEMLQLED